MIGVDLGGVSLDRDFEARSSRYPAELHRSINIGSTKLEVTPHKPLPINRSP